MSDQNMRRTTPRAKSKKIHQQMANSSIWHVILNDESHKGKRERSLLFLRGGRGRGDDGR